MLCPGRSRARRVKPSGKVSIRSGQYDPKSAGWERTPSHGEQKTQKIPGSWSSLPISSLSPQQRMRKACRISSSCRNLSGMGYGRASSVIMTRNFFVLYLHPPSPGLPARIMETADPVKREVLIRQGLAFLWNGLAMHPDNDDPRADETGKDTKKKREISMAETTRILHGYRDRQYGTRCNVLWWTVRRMAYTTGFCKG